MVKRNRRRRPRLKITGDGTGVVNHAGTRLLADLADQLSLTASLSAGLSDSRCNWSGLKR